MCIKPFRGVSLLFSADGVPSSGGRKSDNVFRGIRKRKGSGDRVESVAIQESLPGEMISQPIQPLDDSVDDQGLQQAPGGGGENIDFDDHTEGMANYPNQPLDDSNVDQGLQQTSSDGGEIVDSADHSDGFLEETSENPDGLLDDPNVEQGLNHASQNVLIDLFRRVENKELKVSDAVNLSGYCRRQFQRKLNDFRDHGDSSLIHKGIGKPSNHKLSQETRGKIVELISSWPPGGGPTIINDILRDQHGIFVSTETLRKIMMDIQMWDGGVRKLLHRRTRERKSCFGQLVQMDTSEHEWLGPEYGFFHLVSMIDDATSTVFGRFYHTDSTFTNMDCLRRYFLKYGRPYSIYVDRASHFRYNPPGKVEMAQLPETQLERACRELNITVIHAYSPQA